MLPSGWVAYVENSLIGGEAVLRLIKYNERWRSIIGSATDGVATLDEKGRILEHNTRFFEFMSFKSRHGVALNEEALKGKRLFDLGEDESLLLVEQAFLSSDPKERRFSGEIAVRDLCLGIEMSPAIVPLEGFVGVSLVVKDLTSARELDQLRLDASRAAGIAEVSSNVIHNIGNILNSVNVSVNLLQDRVSSARFERLEQVAAMLLSAEDVGGFLTTDPKGQQIPAYLNKMASHMSDTGKEISSELNDAAAYINQIEGLIAAQQKHAYSPAVVAELRPADLMEEALIMGNLPKSVPGLRIRRDYEPVGNVQSARHSILQILLNLVSNARHALLSKPEGERALTLEVRRLNEETLRFAVTDTGIGVPLENRDRIFEQGFSTKGKGHGTGLHSSALLAGQINGELKLLDATGNGNTTFVLDLQVEGPGEGV